MKTAYQTVQCFEFQTDLHTKLLVEITASESRGKRRYRAAMFRTFKSSEDGSIRKTPWLGTRELALAPGLLRRAHDWIAAQQKSGDPGNSDGGMIAEQTQLESALTSPSREAA